MELINNLRKTAAKYGPAWFIVLQTLGWITFVLLYVGLLFVEFDVAAFLKSHNFGKEVVSIAERGGTFALAFALNRVLMPLRMGLAALLLPFLSEPLNKMVGPYLAQYGLTMDSILGINGQEDKNKEAVADKKEPAAIDTAAAAPEAKKTK
jgi:Protein of unknown function (DUF1279)